MNRKAFERLSKLAEKCAAALKEPRRQSERIWRGDMWAVIAAHHDIQKQRDKKASR